MSMAMVGISVPTFVMGPLLVLIFGLTLYWLPPGGEELELFLELALRGHACLGQQRGTNGQPLWLLDLDSAAVATGDVLGSADNGA